MVETQETTYDTPEGTVKVTHIPGHGEYYYLNGNRISEKKAYELVRRK